MPVRLVINTRLCYGYSILSTGDIRLYGKYCKLTHNSGHIKLADKVSPTSRTQKNGVKNATVTQRRTGKLLLIVQIWASIISILDLYPGASYITPVNTVWVENQKITITSQMKIKFMRSGTLSYGEERLVFSHKEVGTHYLQPGCYMEILLSRVYPLKKIIIGRCSINDFLSHTRIQISYLSKGTSDLMVNTHDFLQNPISVNHILNAGTTRHPIS